MDKEVDKEVDKGTEEQILSAAYRVITRKGKQGARMKEIADEAGVNKALLHYYFRSKDKIYQAVISKLLKRILRTLVADVDFSLPFRELIELFITKHIAAVEKNADILRFFFSEIWANREELVPLLQGALDTSEGPLYRIITERIEKGIAEKELRQVQPVHLIMNIISLDVFYFIAAPLFFSMMSIPKESQKRITADRTKEVVEFVWESVRYREEEDA